MVHLTDAATSSGNTRADLWALVSERVTSGDLEAHVALFILQSALRNPAHSAIGPAWAGMIERLKTSTILPPTALRNAQDVATLGVRLALGFDSNRKGEYADLARRELARAPLPPAPCIHDNERILVGVAAGIGVAAPAQASDLTKLVRSRERFVTIRQGCIDLFAETIATGQSQLSSIAAQRTLELLTNSANGRPAATTEDHIAAYWLASRLLEADWEPTTANLEVIAGCIADFRRSVEHALANGQVRSAIDAAMIIDADSTYPASRLARKSALDGVLAVADSFKASAGVLKKRHGNRPPFEITDEYDVQDLFFALVLPIVPDIVAEDPTSKVANKSSRLDFTSKSTGIGIELKHVKSKADASRVRNEILVDEATYQEHPYVEMVVVFVHDPDEHISTSIRTTFQADLSKPISVSGRTVRYIVRVR